MNVNALDLMQLFCRAEQVIEPVRNQVRNRENSLAAMSAISGRDEIFTETVCCVTGF